MSYSRPNEGEGFDCYYDEWLTEICSSRYKPNFLFSLDNAQISKELIRQVLYYSDKIGIDIHQKLLAFEMLNLYIHKLFQYITRKFPHNFDDVTIQMFMNIKPSVLITLIVLSIKSDGISYNNHGDSDDMKSIFQRLEGITTMALVKECEMEVIKLFQGYVPMKSFYHDVSLIYAYLAKLIRIPSRHFKLMDRVISLFLVNFHSVFRDLAKIDFQIDLNSKYRCCLLYNRLYHASGLIMAMCFYYHLLPHVYIKDEDDNLEEEMGQVNEKKCQVSYRFLALVSKVSPKHIQNLTYVILKYLKTLDFF